MVFCYVSPNGLRQGTKTRRKASDAKALKKCPSPSLLDYWNRIKEMIIFNNVSNKYIKIQIWIKLKYFSLPFQSLYPHVGLMILCSDNSILQLAR